MTQPNDTVDPGVQFEGFASLRNHDGNPVKAVQHAYNQAAQRTGQAAREPVMIRVIVHVAPAAIDFDSEAPLTGGACNIDGPCDSCQ